MELVKDVGSLPSPENLKCWLPALIIWSVRVVEQVYYPISV